MIDSFLASVIIGVVVLSMASGCATRQASVQHDELTELSAKLDQQTEKITTLEEALTALAEKQLAAESERAKLVSQVAVLQNKLSQIPERRTVTTEPASPGDAGGRPMVMSAAELFREAGALMGAGRYNHAILVFEELIGLYPDSELADDATFGIAESFFAREEFRRAQAYYERVAEQFPASDRVSASVLGAGEALEALGDATSAKRVYEALIERYAGSPEAEIAAKRLDRLDKHEEQ